MHRRPISAGRAAVLVLVSVLLMPACSAEPEPADVRGQAIEVLATWADTEQERFLLVLEEFQRRTGAVVRFTSARHGLPEQLRARLAAGDAPDVAFLPQPGLLRELAAAGELLPLDAPTQELVDVHYPTSFRELASYDGRAYGVWFKAANKSLVWYDVATFERLGVVPPDDLEGLLVLARRITASGLPAFAVSGGSGWTLTDWFENLYVRLAGRAAYDELAAHRLAWDDQTVVRTLRAMAALLAPDAVAGGVEAAAATDFADSVVAVFDEPPQAAMVAEGDFVAGVLTGETSARLGVDADVFAFPAGEDRVPAVVGGGDVAVQLRASPAASALLRFLATPDAAAVWAAAGGFVSPNLDVDLAVYPDDVSRGVARGLLEAGDDFRFDLSDLQPAAFGGAEDRGLRAELRAFLVHRDAARAAGRIEAAARAAYEELS